VAQPALHGTSTFITTCQPNIFQANDEGGHQDSSSSSIQTNLTNRCRTIAFSASLTQRVPAPVKASSIKGRAQLGGGEESTQPLQFRQFLRLPHRPSEMSARKAAQDLMDGRIASRWKGVKDAPGFPCTGRSRSPDPQMSDRDHLRSRCESDVMMKYPPEYLLIS
jgi:hypothetical protein